MWKDFRFKEHYAMGSKGKRRRFGIGRKRRRRRQRGGFFEQINPAYHMSKLSRKAVKAARFLHDVRNKRQGQRTQKQSGGFASFGNLAVNDHVGMTGEAWPRSVKGRRRPRVGI
jgi:hypothetical protein